MKKFRIVIVRNAEHRGRLYKARYFVEVEANNAEEAQALACIQGTKVTEIVSVEETYGWAKEPYLQ